MEKYYCDHCRTLFDEQDHCTVCGSYINHKIWIEVQNQQSTNNTASD